MKHMNAILSFGKTFVKRPAGGQEERSRKPFSIKVCMVYCKQGLGACDLPLFYNL